MTENTNQHLFRATEARKPMGAALPIQLPTRLGAALTSALFVLGCDTSIGAHKETAPSATKWSRGADETALFEGCPSQLDGTHVVAGDIDGGAAFTFKGTDVAEIRARVRRMADRHNDRYSAVGGMMMDGDGEQNGAAMEHDDHGPMRAHDGEVLPASHASVTDVEGGAQLDLLSTEPADIETLREHVRMRAERMSRGECPRIAPWAGGPVSPELNRQADQALR